MLKRWVEMTSAEIAGLADPIVAILPVAATEQHGISHVILAGLLANTCIESTGRYAMELGYHVTLLSDATAAFTPEMMHAAHALNGPTFAHAILKIEALIAAVAKA